MNIVKRLPRLSTEVLWFLAATAGLILVVFWEPLSSGLSIWGPDAGSFGWALFGDSLPSAYLGRWSHLMGLGSASSIAPFTPYHLLVMLLPPAYIQTGVYIAAVVGSILACLYFLHGRGVRGWPAWLGSLAFGLTPQTFSLISAGHGGKIMLMPLLALLLACTDRALTRRRPFFYFAVAGCTAGVAFSIQPDLALLFSLLTAAYGLFVLVRIWPRTPRQPVRGEHREELLKLRVRCAGRFLLGAILAAVMLVCVSLASIVPMLRTTLPARNAAVIGSGKAQESSSAAKYEFATNWSLPPEEILEFFVAGVFGWQTGDSKVPYWGKTGRTLGWETHHRGLMNLRQNSHYLGLLQWIFALFAIAWAIRYRKYVASSNTADAPGNTGTSANLTPDETGRRTDVIFWAGALFVSILMALGRNFPLYRLFYMMPYAQDMRCPVKFLHLAEIALCFLFAFGLERLFSKMAESRAAFLNRTPQLKQAGQQRKKHRDHGDAQAALSPRLGLLTLFAALCCGTGLMMLLAAALIPSNAADLLQTWQAEGLGASSDALLKALTWAVTRSGLLLLAAAILFLAARYLSGILVMHRIIPMTLLFLLAIDLGYVARHYIAVWDEYERFTPGELIARIENDRMSYRVSLPVKGGFYDIWQNYLFPRRRIIVTDAEDPRIMSASDQYFYSQLSRNTLRLWQLTSTKHVFGPAGALAPLTNAPSVEVVSSFNVMANGSIQWTASGRQTWLRITNMLPWAAVYSDFECIGEDAPVSRLADPTWDPSRSAIVSATSVSIQPAPGSCVPATLTKRDPNLVEVTTSGGQGGILMLNDRFDPDWKVFVDGKPSRLLRCNCIMRGVELTPGSHTVRFVYRPHVVTFVLNLAAFAVVLIWWAGRTIMGTKDPAE